MFIALFIIIKFCTALNIFKLSPNAYLNQQKIVFIMPWQVYIFTGFSKSLRVDFAVNAGIQEASAFPPQYIARVQSSERMHVSV